VPNSGVVGFGVSRAPEQRGDGVRREFAWMRVGVLVTAIGLAAAACSQSPTAPANYAPFSSTDLVVGTGALAATGETLTVNYTGWLYDPSQPENKGAVFDSTVGRSSFVFTLGSSSVIQGWNQGVAGMRVGGTRRLVIPPSLAYDGARNGEIPPNATLIFEIQLIDVSSS
jgi:FKBP-type peptidyl-prolyl cis-trans isomerase FkpA